MWELDYNESWALKNWCFWTVVLGKTLESPLDYKEFQQVHPKGNQSWIFIGRTDVEAETPEIWPPDAKNWCIWKDPDVGKDWGQEEKGMTEDEVIGWHHRLNGHEWVNSRSWWWTGRPRVQHCMVSQRVGNDWATKLNWTECSARNNPPLAVHNSISFSPVSQCHFMSFLEFTISNVLHYITWPRQRRDYIGHSLAVHCSQGSGCVCCVSAADPWVFSGLTLSCWLHTDITLKCRWFNWTQKLVTGSKHLA